MSIDLPDVSLLVALHIPDHEFHRIAIDWYERTMGFALAPITESGFVRLLLNERITGRTVTPPEVALMVERLLADERAEFWTDGVSISSVGLPARIGAKQVTDFHLVNLARTRQGTLVTLDQRIRQWLPRQLRAFVVCLS